MTHKESLRLARVEAVTNQIRSEMDDVLAEAYAKACTDQDEESAAAIVRKIRNKLLSDSDRELTLDRKMPEQPKGSTFSSWLVFLKALADINESDWSVYRQQLRDLPTQEGFPFNVIFPEKPE